MLPPYLGTSPFRQTKARSAVSSDIKNLALLIAVSLCRLACGLAVVKVLSVMLGPADFGTITQIMGAATIFYVVAGGGIGAGLMLQVGQIESEDTRTKWLASSIEIALASSVILAAIGLTIYLVAPTALFGVRAPSSIMIGIVLAQIAVGIGNNIIAYASGIGNVRAFASANIIGTLVWATLVVSAALYADTTSTFWAVAIAPMAIPLVGIFQLRAACLAGLTHLRDFDAQRRAKLLHAAAYMLMAMVALPIANLIVRADLAQRIDWIAVGLWQSVARLSDAYMQIFGVMITNFVFPKLVQQSDAAGRHAVLTHIGLALLALYTLGAISLYLLRSQVLTIAYSQEFLAASSQIPLQLGADFAKILSWLLVYNIMSTGRLWIQPAAEIWQSILFVGVYFAIVGNLNTEAPVYAHATACVILAATLSVCNWRMRV